MAKRFTFGDVHRLLGKFGFKQTPANGPCVLFEHEPTGVLHAFRAHTPGEQIDPINLTAVRMTLVENGFLERDDFEDALREAAADGKARTRRK